MANVRDIVGLYLDPPEAAVVLCVDEKSQIQALDRTAPMLPVRPGLPASRTHDYVRRASTQPPVLTPRAVEVENRLVHHRVIVAEVPRPRPSSP
jgi:hypothetical protein